MKGDRKRSGRQNEVRASGDDVEVRIVTHPLFFQTGKVVGYVVAGAATLGVLAAESDRLPLDGPLLSSLAAVWQYLALIALLAFFVVVFSQKVITEGDRAGSAERD